MIKKTALFIVGKWMAATGNKFKPFLRKLYLKGWSLNFLNKNIKDSSDHVERKVPKYENHKLRERKVKTLSVCLCVPVPFVISSIPGKSFHFPFP